MKKKLESELVSIAHKILQLKGKEDVVALQAEAKAVYEKLTILKFVEEHFGEVQPTIGKSTVVEKFEQMATNVLSENRTVPESNPHEEDIIIPGIDTLRGIVAEMPEDAQRDKTLEELLAGFSVEPTFVKREAESIEKHTQVEVTTKVEEKKRSLNDTLKRGFNIGLNDKIAFTKHLFGGSTDDYNRVISQLSTIPTYREAEHFITNMVKPDHNNWEGKEEYEARFIGFVESKFE
ncbi:hypothetical protein ACG2LH_02460 [Zhouia sp. PK063]|uniref:hypothetical protein n=1 Tax=Zhouia sp. PK063 TaxID=3373602 RepID=UPI00379078A5